MRKLLFSLLFTAWCIIPALSAGASHQPDIKQPEAPVTQLQLIEIERQDIDNFVADWNERSADLARTPGFISATVYQSILPDHTYQLIEVAQWQSYITWKAAHDGAVLRSPPTGRRIIARFYRPAIAYTHYTAQGDATKANVARLDRIRKDPAITNPEAPFVFINLMEMAQKDIGLLDLPPSDGHFFGVKSGYSMTT